MLIVNILWALACTVRLQSVRPCYGLRGIYGRFDSKIRFERKQTIRRSLSYAVPVSTTYRVVQKRTQFYFGDNFGNSAPILTIYSLLQVTRKHEVLPPITTLLCDIPHYLAKRTLLLISVFGLWLITFFSASRKIIA